MHRDTKDRVRGVLQEHLPQSVGNQELKDDQRLIELGIGVDSVSTLEIIVALEEEFGVTIDDEQVQKGLLEDLQSISRYIEELRGED